MKDYLDKGTRLPVWQLPEKTCGRWDHIASPQIPSLEGQPSLLIHDLGASCNDRAMMTHVRNVFFGPEGTTKTRRFLCNTSGSGKTRILLEGLWNFWGFYFTLRPGPVPVGSSDMERVLSRLEGHLHNLDSIPPDSAQVKSNIIITHLYFLCILYARMFVLHILLQAAGEIKEEHKARWLLIQIAPSILDVTDGDVFNHVNTLLEGCSLQCVETLLGRVRVEINKLLGKQPLFHVFDEAQLTHNPDPFPKYFLSKNDPSKFRPILSMILDLWEIESLSQEQEYQCHSAMNSLILWLRGRGL